MKTISFASQDVAKYQDVETLRGTFLQGQGDFSRKFFLFFSQVSSPGNFSDVRGFVFLLIIHTRQLVDYNLSLICRYSAVLPGE